MGCGQAIIRHEIRVNLLLPLAQLLHNILDHRYQLKLADSYLHFLADIYAARYIKSGQ